ncbi:MAG: helix-turn-helix transcriptional regulator [Candidatus Eisenbacteria bacterium]
MLKRPLESLGAAVRKSRGDRGLRDVAKEIGISPATLMRVENGRVPDLATFAKLCQWLGVDPGDYLGIPRKEADTPEGPLVMSAHFRAERTPSRETVQALAQMLLTAAEHQPTSPLEMDDGDI